MLPDARKLDILEKLAAHPQFGNSGPSVGVGSYATSSGGGGAVATNTGRRGTTVPPAPGQKNMPIKAMLAAKKPKQPVVTSR